MMTTPKHAIAGALAGLLLCASVAAVQPPPPREVRVSFARGGTSATVTGQINGRDDVDYLVRAGAGQTLTVSLKRSNPSNGFNVISPGNVNTAMYVGETGETFTAVLPADGDYRIRVYLGRAAARRPGASSTFTLSVAVTGAALAPLPASKDALVPGTPFHASGSIQCVSNPYASKALTSCQAYVVRRGFDGTATIEVPLSAETKRHILFMKGKPVASDAAGPLTATREGDTTTVTFDSGETYRIPDALVSGG